MRGKTDRPRYCYNLFLVKNAEHSLRSLLLPVIALVLIFAAGCGIVNQASQGLTVSVSLTGTTLPYQSREINILFSKQIDPATVAGNISLSDKNGSLDDRCTCEVSSSDATNKTICIRLNTGFSLTDSWLYTVSIKAGLRSVDGDSLNTEIKVATSNRDPFALPSPFASGPSSRTLTVVISDIHMGEERAASSGYCWFTDNSGLLEKFLDDIASSGQVKELVVNGDFFDEWVIPMATQPYQPGVNSDEDYFLSVANAPLNKNIITKLNAIADAGAVRVVYVPGNHDMLMTETIMKKIIPNIVWCGEDSSKGIAAGNGEYKPESGIAMEHGHRYDLFNSADPLTRPGSLLPPGYFISRVFATKMTEPGGVTVLVKPMSVDLSFVLAWDVAVAKINVKDLDKNAAIIKTGVNGYTADMSVNGAQANYSSSIGSRWDQRQQINGVYSKVSEWSAILNGSGIGWWGDLEEPAEFQYLLPGRARIVVFGHSHKAMIRKNIFTSEKIYVNTGTWVNESLVSKGFYTRTFVVISPSTATGSEIDTVTLYQYNGTKDAKQLGEETIKM